MPNNPHIMQTFQQFIESKQDKILIICRGISGSGKSTLSKGIKDKENGVVFSTDEYHYKNGVYAFDQENKDLYHKMNLERSISAIKAGKTPILIDNTNIKFEYAKPYIIPALEHGYQVKVLEPNTPWAFNADELSKRNSGRAPKEVIGRMLKDWEPHEVFMNKLKTLYDQLHTN